jgi:hypothetical protein
VRPAQRYGHVVIPILECGRQTGGSGSVVSDGAVLDRNLHSNMFGSSRRAIKSAPRFMVARIS